MSDNSHSWKVTSRNNKLFVNDDYVLTDIRIVKAFIAQAATITKLKAAGNHYPECNFHSWDWNFSWDKTDCSCPLD